MKKCVLLGVVLLIALSIKAQSDSICGIIPSKNGVVFYSEVVTTNQPASELYQNSKIWIGKFFTDAKAVIQTDVPNSSIMLKGNIKDGISRISFSLLIQMKEGRYKYEFTDVIIDIHSNYIDKSGAFESYPFVTECDKDNLLKYDKIFKNLFDTLKNNIKTDNW